jgi:hypothetical protein
MPLISLDLPKPASLRGGWSAMAAVLAARGWNDFVYATSDQWLYHDGGGNWACLRFQDKGRAVLLGHDHEYSDTYFGAAAEYFDEEETNLLADAPEWWSLDLDPSPFGEWIGFIYGWDGQKWQRTAYEKDDGFASIGLLDDCSINGTKTLSESAMAAPGLKGEPPDTAALVALIEADANITDAMLEAVVPGWDIAAGVAAAHQFLKTI